MDALIMAGGKGTRLKIKNGHELTYKNNTNKNNNIEKPLLKINGISMIDYIIEELLKSDINNIYIAVSKNTPETEKYLTKKYGSYNNIFIINTSGVDYIHDLNECIKYFSEPFMVLSCDTPTINSNTINKIMNHYQNISKSSDVESLCVAIDKDKYIGNPTIVINNCIPAGINILSPKYGEQKEETYIIDEPLININTLEDKALVEKMLKTK
jgi:adenosylcobinamide-phosphate guanylyltransferase